MFTQCQKCQTTFRISAEQLRIANGQARCSQCGEVFNALELFADTAEETAGWPESRFIESFDIGSEVTPYAKQVEIEDSWESREEAALSVPDPLSELGYDSDILGEENPQEPTELEDQKEDLASATAQPGIDTRFTDYLAELELQDEKDSSREEVSDSYLERHRDELLDSLDIDEETELDLPVLDEPEPDLHKTATYDTSDSDWLTDASFKAPLNAPETNDSEEPKEETSESFSDLDQITPESLEVNEDDPDEDVFINVTPREETIEVNETSEQPLDETQPFPSSWPRWSSKQLVADKDARDDIPFQLQEDVPEIEPSESEGLTVDDVLSNKHPKRGKRFILTLLVLLLITAVSTQIAWIYREQLLEVPILKPHLNQLCEKIDCQLPVKRALEKFEVINRSLVIAPDKPHLLQLDMTFANNANFPQAYPGLRLSLMDNSEKLIARRVFKPQEYLQRSVSEHSLIQPREQISISLALEESSENISGYQFDFE